MHINLQRPRTRDVLRDSDRIVASSDGNHFFTFRPDWAGPVPLPFRAAAATIDLIQCEQPRVLILGFGMGAMGALMLQRNSQAKVVGVEPDRKLHRAASVGLDEKIALHRADAVSFLRRSSESFDLILDDCFVVKTNGDGEDEPYRPAKLEVMPELAKKLLSAGGIYARNLLDQADLTLATQREHILSHFSKAYDRVFKEWDNVLTIATDGDLDERLISELGSK